MNFSPIRGYKYHINYLSFKSNIDIIHFINHKYKKEEKMLHTKSYFTLFGILANSINRKLLQLYSMLKELKHIVIPIITKNEQQIINNIKNQTTIQI